MSMMSSEELSSDQLFIDTVVYGSRKNDSITDVTETSVATQHQLKIGDKTYKYTARAGHLVIADLYNGRPAAKIFYVAFPANVKSSKERPVTFFYNGGPGSSPVYLLGAGIRRRMGRTPY
ncbi:hypothetical protein LQG66_17720 [Bradyrhizobium ontarionense]|uniref:Peptidase S10 n=1 Tax=Bradyrhizobium ontarionense TaxID=2898149 RepID=A0ABY3RMJ2_9BRAD|nr:hypothetical protein [Bradyrhizobium sp. A19]UFZ08018.1 hypothetical protein LQG66_17720 [Bradyrhizobium sp. A19]